jgi:acetyltransferase-like isoleucine patch superfamily enzyme
MRRLLKYSLLAGRMIRLRILGVTIQHPSFLGTNISARPGTGSRGRGNIKVDHGARLEQGVILHAFGGTINLGTNLFLGPYCVIYGHGGVQIGADCLIGTHSRILSSNHAIPEVGVSIHSCPDILLPTKLGRGVWLGAGVTILGGVTVGDGCVVGAGAVVTHDLPEYSIAMGVPARIVQTRKIHAEQS